MQIQPFLLSDDLPLGTVYGALLNDRATVQRLAPQFDSAPYKAAPRAPVLYIKPRNTFAPDGAAVATPAELRIDATIGLVIGEKASRVTVDQALKHVAGFVLASDLTLSQLRITGGGIHHFYACAPDPGWQRLGSSLTGILPEPDFGELVIELSPGDFFCFMTDGFYEMLTKQGRPVAPASAVAMVDLLRQCAESPERWDDGAALSIEIR